MEHLLEISVLSPPIFPPFIFTLLMLSNVGICSICHATQPHLLCMIRHLCLYWLVPYLWPPAVIG